MSDTVSVSSAEDSDGDDTDPTDRSSIWTARESSGVPPTPPQSPQPRSRHQDRVHRPADPYARAIHIPSGRPSATWAKRFAAYLIDGLVFGVALIYVEFWIQGLALNAVVINVSTPQMVEVPAPGYTGEASIAATGGKSTNDRPTNRGENREKPGWPKRAAALLARAVPRSRKVWITAAVSLVAVAVVALAVITAARMNADAHSPDLSAIAYLKARADRNVTAMLDNATVVTPPPSSQKASFLLMPRDIATAIDAPGNPTEAVSNVKVLATAVSKTGNSARVTLDYVAGGGDKETTYSLVADDHIASGWAVQVTPEELDVQVPQGAVKATIDGIAVPLDGQNVVAWLFPALYEVATPATAVYQAQSTRVDLTGAHAASVPIKVSLPAQLTPQATTSAQAAVAAQITNCLAATSLTPANCPNNDIPATTSQGDAYTNIAWTGLGDPTAGLTVTLGAAGTVTVAGSMTDEVTYTDTTSGDSFFGPVSNVQTDGPTSVWFSYPVTWNGTAWSLGTVQASNTPPANQPSSSA